MTWVRCRPIRPTVRALQYVSGNMSTANVEIFTKPDDVPKMMGSSSACEWLEKNQGRGAVARIRGRWFVLFPGNWIVEESPVNLKVLTDEQFHQEYEI